MRKNVIHIYGASGSGISTIGRYLCEKTGFFFMDTDDYFWEATNPPYTIKRPKSERLFLIKDEMSKHDNVVISGSLVGWGDELMSLFTLAIRVETIASTRLGRIREREQERFGSRIEKGGDMHQTHQNFLE